MIYKKLYGEIEDYCALNELDVIKTVNETLRSGFTILKFGMPNSTSNPIEKTVEVIKEVIKEVPVDRIVEVEKIVERIVEIEVPVDKIVEKSININVDGHNVNYMDYIEELNNKISKLEINNKKIGKELTDSTLKSGELEKELSECKVKLTTCLKDNSGFDLYGER